MQASEWHQVYLLTRGIPTPILFSHTVTSSWQMDLWCSDVHVVYPLCLQELWFRELCCSSHAINQFFQITSESWRDSLLIKCSQLTISLSMSSLQWASSRQFKFWINKCIWRNYSKPGRIANHPFPWLGRPWNYAGYCMTDWEIHWCIITSVFIISFQ